MSKSESIELLKTMFREVGVTSTWTRDDALRNVKDDSRFKFLKISISEQKQAFSDFIVEQRERERE